jgi:YD repeat-containing protein
LGVFARYWLPVFAYVTVIFVLSAQPHLRPPVKVHNADKIAHALEYFGLGFLLVRALHGGRSAAPPLALGTAALLCGMVVGASDELFQRLIPGRESSVFDFLADSAGLVLAQLVFVALRD